jgi:hypothetical protein
MSSKNAEVSAKAKSFAPRAASSDEASLLLSDVPTNGAGSTDVIATMLAAESAVQAAKTMHKPAKTAAQNNFFFMQYPSFPVFNTTVLDRKILQETFGNVHVFLDARVQYVLRCIRKARKRYESI